MTLWLECCGKSHAMHRSSMLLHPLSFLSVDVRERCCWTQTIQSHSFASISQVSYARCVWVSLRLYPSIIFIHIVLFSVFFCYGPHLPLPPFKRNSSLSIKNALPSSIPSMWASDSMCLNFQVGFFLLLFSGMAADLFSSLFCQIEYNQFFFYSLTQQTNAGSLSICNVKHLSNNSAVPLKGA